MEYLYEYQDFNYETIVEDIDKTIKKTYLKGLFQHAGVRNGNGRVYPHRILEREINTNQDKIRGRGMMGELDHPNDGKIHLPLVSHAIVEATMLEDGRVIGKAEVFDGPDEAGGTPTGRILGSLIKRRMKIGISSRGAGTTRNIGGTNEVQEDYKLITWDMVSDPSTPHAFPAAIYEDKGNYNENNWFKEKKDTVSFSEVLSENLDS